MNILIKLIAMFINNMNTKTINILNFVYLPNKMKNTKYIYMYKLASRNGCWPISGLVSIALSIIAVQPFHVAICNLVSID